MPLVENERHRQRDRRASKRAPAPFQPLDDSDLLSEGAARLPAG
jgi:hypothetical protein